MVIPYIIIVVVIAVIECCHFATDYSDITFR